MNTLTQMVKLQRVQRERKSFTEKAMHELDNRQAGAKKIRGIYQWVDKKYKARILNYGKRLLYDVVVPEPAAFLIDSLKKAVQPESFQLTKPARSAAQPDRLESGHYIVLRDRGTGLPGRRRRRRMSSSKRSCTPSPPRKLRRKSRHMRKAGTSRYFAAFFDPYP